LTIKFTLLEIPGNSVTVTEFSGKALPFEFTLTGNKVTVTEFPALPD
jgi:hypothetical protein